MEDQHRAAAGRGGHEAWPEFFLPWDDAAESATDVSWLLPRPAGASGFVRVDGGRLATGDGRRWRAWGVMLSGGMALPSMDRAGRIARRLAKLGVNCIRLHHIDQRWPDGILVRHSTGRRIPGITVGGDVAYRDDEPTRALDPEAMARLDWFMARCKDHGIYFDLNLNVTRPFTRADGVKDAEQIGFGKGLTYFDERLIELQKEYAGQVLDHVNPFTANRYADEPAVAIVEILNENSLLDNWVRGALVPVEGAAANRGHWAHIPPSYARDLDGLWNRWLAARYAARDALAAAWEGDLREGEDAAAGTVRRLSPDEFAAASGARFRDEARFLAGIERRFFEDMKALLRDGLGVRQPIVGTSDYNPGYSALPMLEANTAMDVMDGHGYWQLGLPAHENTPMVDCPDGSLPALLSRGRVRGRPFIVSEVNETATHDYGCECIPTVTAYALLQDWDGILWCKYRGLYSGGAMMGPDPQWPWERQAISGVISIGGDPVRMSQLAAGALMFHRGDVRAAERIVQRAVPYEWALDSLRAARPGAGRPYWLAHLPGRLALVHRTAISDFHAAEVSPGAGDVVLPAGKIVSDTGELTWAESPAGGRVLVDAPRHQAIVMRAGRAATRNMTVELATPFAAIQLAALDDRPLAETDRALLVAVARSANTAMVFNETRTAVLDWGGPPTRIEPVVARLTLTGLVGAKAVFVQPLDGRGQALGEPRRAEPAAGGFAVALTPDTPTTWYAVHVRR